MSLSLTQNTDKRSVGSITSQLQDDAARLQAFSGEPIRSMLTAMSAVIIGVTLSFIVRLYDVALFPQLKSRY